jgi:alkanesulfonate monooxygenase SsuD/methylene tetrahydromethanopterin reductase-like flavin-dependent oxidoreductase (luciferase family)
MKFGVFYELQLPKPWDEGAEHRLFHEALDQVVLADRIGIDYAWEVEHHFLDEYSHSSAPEVFLATAAACPQRIRRCARLRCMRTTPARGHTPSGTRPARRSAMRTSSASGVS